MCVFSTHYTFLVSVSYYYLGLQSVSFVDTLPHNKLVSEPRSYDLGILNIFFGEITIRIVLFIRYYSYGYYSQPEKFLNLEFFRLHFFVTVIV